MAVCEGLKALVSGTIQMQVNKTIILHKRAGQPDKYEGQVSFTDFYKVPLVFYSFCMRLRRVRGYRKFASRLQGQLQKVYRCAFRRVVWQFAPQALN